MTPKTSSGRWLAGISISVVVLAIVAVIVTLVAGSGDPKPLPSGSPEAAVQDFILAVDKGDYNTAYAMLHPDVQDYCSPTDFASNLTNQRDNSLRISLKSVDTIAGQTHVTVDITNFYGSPPFDYSESTYPAMFVVEQVDGTWMIQEAPYQFSGCAYRLKPPTPTPSPTPTPTVTPAAS